MSTTNIRPARRLGTNGRRGPNLVVLVVVVVAVAASASCAPDPPDTVAAAQAQFVPIMVDPFVEARTHNGGRLYEFVVDDTGFVTAPDRLPAGEAMLTLTYVGDAAAPHSLVFEAANGDQPIVAVDVPGSNNGVVALAPGIVRFYDGAPGNRAKGYEGAVLVVGRAEPPSDPVARPTYTWATAGTTFTSAPSGIVPADVPVVLELSVTDALPHSVAFEHVRGGQPLVAVDGPGTNRREIELPAGTYVYYCAVPGHREAGMVGLLTAD